MAPSDIAAPQMPATASPEEGAFLAPWKPNDASSLQAERLPIARVTRAWERRPQAASSRIQKRIGTIWKRPSAMTPSFSLLPHLRGNFLRRRSGGNSNSPRIATKKQCVETEFGMGSTVSQWELRGSPTRKIVTRSNAVADQELMALPGEDDEIVPGAGVEVDQDEQDEGDEGDVTVEILDEHGTVVAVGDQSLVESGDWEDLQENLPFDDALMRPEEAVNHPQLEDLKVGQLQSTDVLKSLEMGTVSSAPTNAIQLNAARQGVILPDGFVSPVKQRRQLGGRARQVASDRRYTLPVQFASALPGPSATERHPTDTAPSAANTDAAEEADSIDQSEQAEIDVEPAEEALPIEGIKHTVADEDEEWEDVEQEEECHSQIRQLSDEEAIAAQLAADTEASQSIEGDTNITTDITEESERRPILSTATPPRQTALPSIILDRALTSSPIPTITSPHPRLPLRRSPRREPRRQSTSPLKQNLTLSDPKRSHLIAFTPLRRPFASVLEAYSPAEETPSKDDSPLPPTSLEKSASAPAFEVKMSPTKPARPRVSDDTALLQAFLNRAAESKTSRQSSAAADVEALARRRDSDAVKKALASPGQGVDVLAELDPNSPSPRKSVTMVPESPLIRRSNETMEDHIGREDEPITFDLDETVPRTRSGRARKKPELLSQAAAAPPNKIQIRGQTSAVEIRKSEAQEVAILTRSNTRKNKGQAVFPPLRLKKLASAEPGDDTSTSDSAIQKDTSICTQGKRNVTWAENLVAYSGDLVEPETSVVSVEVGSLEQNVPAAAPRASDTPSKPKLRRLRTTRTAVTSAPETIAGSTAAELKPKSSSAGTKRKVRVGTPAKGLGNESLLPELDSIEEPAAEVAPVVIEKKPVAKRRVTSRIPAPASSFTAQGKENLISSPPKKKAISTITTSKSTATKLEFVKSNTIEPPTSTPGLASPAKKAGRKIIQFGNIDDVKGQSNEDTMTIPGLASPAKKRMRRTAV